MKAITFLGAAKAWPTTYYLPDGREHTAPYFPAALVRFYPVSTLLVFVTEGARQMHYDQLATLTEGHVQEIRPVPIPDGRDEAELWQIFQAVADAAQPGDRVIFDITHGFRSLPFLSFLAAAYLRAVKEVTLEAVLYGAFEAGDRSISPARAPVFDLTRFVSLLDWLTAADRFARFGDSRDLATLLRDRNATPVHLAAATGNQEARQMARLLKRTAAALEGVALPLRVVQPMETMEAAAQLVKAIDQAQAGFQPWAQPFALIVDEVRTTYAPFALANPLHEDSLPQSLAIQRDLVSWYLEKEQVVQAMTLAREWLISWVMGWLAESPLDARERRETVAGVVGTESHRLLQERSSGQGPFRSSFLRGVPSLEQVLLLFQQISQVRNDLDHAGMREGSMPAKALVKRAADLGARLAALPLPEGVPLADLESAHDPA